MTVDRAFYKKFLQKEHCNTLFHSPRWFNRLRRCLLAAPSDRTLLDLELLAMTLKRFRFFSTLADSIIVALCKVIRYAQFARGDIVFHQGDRGDNFYAILIGSVQVFTGPKGSELLASTMHQGQGFGELALLNNAPRAATIKVATNATFLTLSRDEYERCLAKLMRVEAAKKYSFLKTVFPSIWMSGNKTLIATATALCEIVSYETGDTVCKQGKHINRIGFLCTGALHVTLTAKFVSEIGQRTEETMKLTTLRPGGGIGVMELHAVAGRWHEYFCSMTAACKVDVMWVPLKAYRMQMPKAATREHYGIATIFSEEIRRKVNEAVHLFNVAKLDLVGSIKMPIVVPSTADQGDNDITKDRTVPPRMLTRAERRHDLMEFLRGSSADEDEPNSPPTALTKIGGWRLMRKAAEQAKAAKAAAEAAAAAPVEKNEPQNHAMVDGILLRVRLRKKPAKEPRVVEVAPVVEEGAKRPEPLAHQTTTLASNYNPDRQSRAQLPPAPHPNQFRLALRACAPFNHMEGNDAKQHAHHRILEAPLRLETEDIVHAHATSPPDSPELSQEVNDLWLSLSRPQSMPLLEERYLSPPPIYGDTEPRSGSPDSDVRAPSRPWRRNMLRRDSSRACVYARVPSRATTLADLDEDYDSAADSGFDSFRESEAGSDRVPESVDGTPGPGLSPGSDPRGLWRSLVLPRTAPHTTRASHIRQQSMLKLSTTAVELRNSLPSLVLDVSSPLHSPKPSTPMVGTPHRALASPNRTPSRTPLQTSSSHTPGPRSSSPARTTLSISSPLGSVLSPSSEAPSDGTPKRAGTPGSTPNQASRRKRRSQQQQPAKTPNLTVAISLAKQRLGGNGILTGQCLTPGHMSSSF
eukprot:CAMPEP_0114561062 /NCGR_PEP_ID=MMETSP0114-20121206/11801_1 /TAXON_ID=31324 /ORGANISM="Goniomonas sp, Strain m" /LENGTH=864 /DNA_ID=CAMNT_0001746667 /DNA_START=15 /DNA_END=2609 /DNA_ORIENTATION=+